MSAAAALLVLTIGVADPATCAAPPASSRALAAIDARERLGWIDRTLQAEAARARRWTLGWSIGIGAAGLISLAPAPFVSADSRVDWIAGGVTAAIGVIPFLVAPLAVSRDAPRLRASLEAAQPLDDDRRLCLLLADAEQKLEKDAANQRSMRGWWSHAGNVLFNLGVTAVLGFGYHHWASGIINGAAGIAVGEVVIFTQPNALTDDWNAYRRADLARGQ
jgi:hypothetical protein